MRVMSLLLRVSLIDRCSDVCGQSAACVVD